MLPRQLSYGNVDHQVSKGEEIVPAAQLVAQVGIDGDEASCADQVFSCPEIYMLSCFLINYAARQTEINHVDSIWAFHYTHHYIIRLYISMNNSFVMHEL